MKRVFALSIFLMVTIGCGPEPEGSRGPAECTDAFDNDQDGLVDCDDPDCGCEGCGQMVYAYQECLDEYTSTSLASYPTVEEVCSDGDSDYSNYYACVTAVYSVADCSTQAGFEAANYSYGSQCLQYWDWAKYGSDPLNIDSDLDSYSDYLEFEAGTDPLDASDSPYLGGWPIDVACRDNILSTGNDVGQIASQFNLIDQFGEIVNSYDFCNHTILLASGAFW